MKHASLLNPFELNRESVQIPGRQRAPTTPNLTRATPVCSVCQSDDITSQATVQWSNESQEWELANTFDQPAHCNHCGSACGITWLPLN